MLVTYCNVGNINAETVVSRNRDLKVLYQYLSDKNTDEMYNWSIPIGDIRPTFNYNVDRYG